MWPAVDAAAHRLLYIVLISCVSIFFLLAISVLVFNENEQSAQLRNT